MSKFKTKKAFTLIELLVVIAIIGILVTIAVIALNSARSKARDAKRVANIKQVQTALELFFNDKNRYPTLSEYNSGALYSTSSFNGTTTYMEIVPEAPTPPDGACSNLQNQFSYTPTNNGGSYTISYCLGNPTGSIAEGPHCATPSGVAVGNVCGNNVAICTPDCAGKNCGDDGCGGSCGTCTGTDICSSGVCAPPPTCLTDPTDCFWQPVGTPGFSSGLAEYSSLFVNNEAAYVSYRGDVSMNYSARVMKYTGNGATGWEYVGGPSFSNGNIYNTSLSALDSGNIYVLYRDGGLGFRATVMKYTGNGATGWESVGTPGFSPDQTEYNSLFFDDNSLYAAYKDGANSFKATVMRYTGNGATGWEPVGTPGFSAGTVWYVSLAVSNNIPYVAYHDAGFGYKAVVMRYTGNGATGWEPVGTPGFSAGSVNLTDLAVSNNIPYIAFRDGANSSRATVMKYTGNGATGWEPVGTPGFSEMVNNSYLSIFVYNNIPYLAYKIVSYDNPLIDGKIAVMKYTGNGATGWESVGVLGFSAGTIGFPNIFIYDDIIYASYKDEANSGKMTVMKFDK